MNKPTESKSCGNCRFFFEVRSHPGIDGKPVSDIAFQKLRNNVMPIIGKMMNPINAGVIAGAKKLVKLYLGLSPSDLSLTKVTREELRIALSVLERIEKQMDAAKE